MAHVTEGSGSKTNMTLTEALAANKQEEEIRSEAVPEFDLDRLAKEVDVIFQEKFDIAAEIILEKSDEIAIAFEENIAEKVTEYKEKVAEIFPDIKEQLLAEIARGRTIIVLPTGNEINVQHMDHPEMVAVVKSLSLQKKAMLVGPAGTGKTTMVEQIAERMDLPFYKYSCSRDSSVHDLIGYKQPRSETYLETTFLKAYENGGIFLVDEYDAMSGDMSLFFNGVADNSKFISIPHRDDKPQAVKHKDFLLVMCGNTWGKGSTDYSGRDFQDLALMDRFRFCRHFIGYNELLEKEFMKHNHNTILTLRSKLEQVGSYLSTRNIQDISNLIQADVPFMDIISMTLQDLPEQDMHSIRSNFHAQSVRKEPALQTQRADHSGTTGTIIRDGSGDPYDFDKMMWAYPPNDRDKLMELNRTNSTLCSAYIEELKRRRLF